MSTTYSKMPLRIDPTCLGEEFILLNIRPCHEYKGGVKGPQVGYTHDVYCPPIMRHFGVKVPGKQTIDILDGRLTVVKFTDLVVKPYADSEGKLALSASAAAIWLADDEPD